MTCASRRSILPRSAPIIADGAAFVKGVTADLTGIAPLSYNSSDDEDEERVNMRKGDEKRQALLDLSEGLFLGRGYVQTSIQDILDAADMSKGGFYHHFAGKEEILRALCQRRAERAADRAADALTHADTPMGRINAILHAYLPLCREEVSFTAMLLPALTGLEGRALAMHYQAALEEQFAPLLRREIASAAAAGAVYPPVDDPARMLLCLLDQAWMTLAARLTADALEPLALLDGMKQYRRAVELLLDAPYGTVEIIRAEELAEVADILRRAWQDGAGE